MIGKMCITTIDFDKGVDSPTDVLNGLAEESKQSNLVKLNIFGKPNYNYLLRIYINRTNEAYPLVNGYVASEESYSLKSDAEAQADKFIEQNRELFAKDGFIIMPIITKEWVKKNV